MEGSEADAKSVVGLVCANMEDGATDPWDVFGSSVCHVLVCANMEEAARDARNVGGLVCVCSKLTITGRSRRVAGGIGRIIIKSSPSCHLSGSGRD